MTKLYEAPVAQVLAPMAPSLDAVVIKLGGSILDAGDAALDDIAALHRAGYQVVLIHGGGPMINQWLQRLGIVPRFIAGRRVTDSTTLEIVRAVMAGQINTEIVRLLGLRGIRAVGLSGLDAGMIHVQQAPAELGLVGIEPSANPAVIQAVLALPGIPVITSLGLGPDGACLNVNADDVATAIAVALHASDLIFMSDVPGVRDAAGNVIAQLTAAAAQQLIAEGVIAGGMVPKIQGCLAALDHVQRIHILAGQQPGALRALLGTERHFGTQIVQE